MVSDSSSSSSSEPNLENDPISENPQERSPRLNPVVPMKLPSAESAVPAKEPESICPLFPQYYEIQVPFEEVTKQMQWLC
jgi:hypothetical protein